jgi:hypothetical protein
MADRGASADGSLAGFASLDAMLEQHLPAAQLAEARRVLYGASRGARHEEQAQGSASSALRGAALLRRAAPSCSCRALCAVALAGAS